MVKSIRVATRVALVPFIGDGGFFCCFLLPYQYKEELYMLDVKFVRDNYEEVKAKLSETWRRHFRI